MSLERKRAAAALVLALASGCALTEKATPREVAHYTPEQVRPGVAGPQPASRPALRLGRVASGTDLGERIVFRDDEYQVGYYEGRRWTERPEVYVRRSLTRVLFEESGLRRALGGDAPTLDVELVAFEEVRRPGPHAARIVLRLVLSTDRVLLEDTLTVSEPVVGDRFDDVVAAMARAIDKTSEDVARRVDATLSGL